MEIKTELLKGAVSDIINSHLDEVFNINADDIADTVATKMLSEIQLVIKSDKSDFDKIEEIVRIFEENKIDAGGCHDFG